MLWFADSKWSLLLQNNALAKAGLMHTYGFRLLDSTTMPFKVTMCYTDPPAAPGASEVLVNDLDLLVQRTTTVMILNTSIGKKVPTDVFQRQYGNARGGTAKDGFNTCEVFSIAEHPESVVTVSSCDARMQAARLACPSEVHWAALERSSVPPRVSVSFFTQFRPVSMTWRPPFPVRPLKL